MKNVFSSKEILLLIKTRSFRSQWHSHVMYDHYKSIVDSRLIINWYYDVESYNMRTEERP